MATQKTGFVTLEFETPGLCSSVKPRNSMGPPLWSAAELCLAPFWEKMVGKTHGTTRESKHGHQESHATTWWSFEKKELISRIPILSFSQPGSMHPVPSQAFAASCIGRSTSRSGRGVPKGFLFGFDHRDPLQHIQYIMKPYETITNDMK